MYLLKKDKGSNQNIILENTDKKVGVNLGRISIELLHILEDGDGISTSAPADSPKHIDLGGVWNVEVSTETKDKLVKLTMPMKKPDRAKVKTEQQQPVVQDATSILLGFAK